MAPDPRAGGGAARPGAGPLPGQLPRGQAVWEQASDVDLLGGLAAGHGEAFDVLYGRHSVAMMSFLSRLVTGRVDPEDLLQETFLRVLRHAREFDSSKAFRPWIYTIARNIAYNAMSRSHLRADLEIQVDLSDWRPPRRSARSGDPSLALEQREQQARVVAALEVLPPRHREILVLVIFEGFTYEEAAAITGDPEGTLRSRVFHALRKLREHLKESS